MPTCRRDITTAATAALVRANNVEARATIDTETVDRPMRMVDGFERAGLGVLREYAGSQIEEHGNDGLV
ncbi:hypothetical protein D3C84_1188960 [compost metagenome]